MFRLNTVVFSLFVVFYFCVAQHVKTLEQALRKVMEYQQVSVLSCLKTALNLGSPSCSILQALQHTATKMSYKILEEIYRGIRRIAYCAGRERDKQPVILKIYIAEFLTERQVAHLNREIIPPWKQPTKFVIT